MAGVEEIDYAFHPSAGHPEPQHYGQDKEPRPDGRVLAPAVEHYYKAKVQRKIKRLHGQVDYSEDFHIIYLACFWRTVPKNS